MCATEKLLLAAAGLLGRHVVTAHVVRAGEMTLHAVRLLSACASANSRAADGLKKVVLFLGPVFAEDVSCPAGPRGGLQGTQKATIHNT
jgi:hypothetical protein